MRILIIAAHPDDEVLGCGGTIARHALEGDHIDVIFTADGTSSRGKDAAKQEERCKMARLAAEILGASPPSFLLFPDNKMDSVPLLEIVQKLERLVDEIRPQIVYTHHHGDLNIDHRVTCRAVLVACRPLPGSPIVEICGFEVRSSTEWAASTATEIFLPTCFTDITETFDRKMQALRQYDSEMCDFPHSRSYKSVEAQAVLRGSQVGLPRAEAFSVIRKIRRQNGTRV